jgi:flagellar biosynthesis protein FlhA
MLDHLIEDAVSEGVQSSEAGSYLAIDPIMARNIMNGIAQMSERFAQSGSQPLVITSPNTRRHLKKLTERQMPSLVVLSFNEIPPNIKIQSLGVVTVNAS